MEQPAAAHELNPIEGASVPKEVSGGQNTSSSSLRDSATLNIESNEPVKAEWKASKSVVLAFVTICVLTLMVSLDSTSIGVALPTIARALHASSIEAFWAGTGFLLCATVFQPNFVSLSSIFGRRPLFSLAVLFFLIGAIVAAVAKTPGELLVGRCIQGIGGGGIMSITEVMIADLIPMRQRGEFYGHMNAMWAVGSVCGPIIGGAFGGADIWRWVFWINLPFIGIGIPCIIFFMKFNFVRKDVKDQLLKFDWIGSIIFVGSTAAFLIPLTWGGVMYRWDSWRTLVPMLIGVAGIAGFIVYEGFVTSNPIIPIALFKNRTTTISFCNSVFSGLTIWCIIYYLPLYFEAVKGYSPVITGVCLFPQTFTIAPAGIVGGVLITKTGRYRWATWLGWALATTGLGLFCIIKVSTSIPGWIFLNLVSGLGLGLLFPSVASAVQASVDPKDVPMALAMFSFFRSVGQAIGVAIGGVIFQNRLVANLQTYPALAPKAHEYGADATSLVEIIKAMPESQDKDDLKTAFVDSLRIVWAVTCALAGFALILSLFLKEHSLDQDFDDQEEIQKAKSSDESQEPLQI